MLGKGAARQAELSVDDKLLLSMSLRRVSASLGLRLRGTMLGSCIRQLHHELAAKGLRFRPTIWVSSSWFSPDGVAGFAVPFYLLHERLLRLEASQVGEVEGDSREECMKLLRHECGHAIDNAFGLRKLARRRQLFGLSSEPYRARYSPRKYSKNYVRHIEPHYAQSHPDEDFAETFAVWLTPGSNWRRRYADWGALEKLKYMDSLMDEIANDRASEADRTVLEPIEKLSMTLEQYYRAKRRHMQISKYQRERARLEQLDSLSQEKKQFVRALQSVRIEAIDRVHQISGERKYAIDQLMKRVLDEYSADILIYGEEEALSRDEIVRLLASRANRYLRAGVHKIAR